jgi:hypothetical protein
MGGLAGPVGLKLFGELNVLADDFMWTVVRDPDL